MKARKKLRAALGPAALTMHALREGDGKKPCVPAKNGAQENT
jgi:hypothetical protein